MSPDTSPDMRPEIKEDGNLKMQPMNHQHDALNEELDPELAAALSSFRGSVQAWSDAAYHRPRTLSVSAHGAVWRRVAGWAAVCGLMIAVATGGVYQHEQRLKQDRAMEAAVRLAERQQHQADVQTAAEDKLLAHVDSDVSREVPAALDPLASLVSEDDTQ